MRKLRLRKPNAPGEGGGRSETQIHFSFSKSSCSLWCHTIFSSWAVWEELNFKGQAGVLQVKRKGWERTGAGGLWQRVGADTEAHKDWSLQETKWLGRAGRGLYPWMASDELKRWQVPPLKWNRMGRCSFKKQPQDGAVTQHGTRNAGKIWRG